MHGYAGKVLEIDLSTGDISTRDLDEQECHDFLGGAGLAAKIYLDMFPGDVDPLSPDNPLIFMTGPWTGSRVPGGNRFAVAARSPQTMLWGEASCGGYWGPELKAAGYDGIILTGASDKPVYIWIRDDQVELRDAADLWGKDSYETADTLIASSKEEVGKKAKVAAIGQAGENGVSFAAIVHDKHHIAGRTGMGAVMGSKNVKAIAVVGTGKRPEPADPEGMKEWLKPVLEDIKTSVVVDSVRTFGTNANFEVGSWLGDVPFKNWQVGENDEVAGTLNGPTYCDEILVKNYACWSCPIGCKRVVKVDEGPFQMEQGAGPEYETVCMFGSNLLNGSLAAVAKGNDVCNRYGLDTITMGEIVAVVTECQEKGLLTHGDCDGIEIDWNDPVNMLKLIDLTVTNKGFGAKMALGSKRLTEWIGGEAPAMAVQVRGLDQPAHDPRGFHGFAIAYATSVRGACHCASSNLYLEQGAGKLLPKFDLGGPFDEQVSEGKGYMTARAQDIGQLFNSAVICVLTAIAWTDDQLIDAMNVVTGFGYDAKGFLRTGERAWFVKRGLQQLWGSSGADDTMPPRIGTPVQEGAAAGSIPNMELMKKDFYEERQLDEQGLLTRGKLDELNLTTLVERLGV